MAKQAAAFRASRPDIKNPVQHFSINLPASDGRKTPEEWKPIVEAFLQKIGFPKDGAWASFLHDDTDHQHVHVIFLRQLGNGQIWNNAFSQKRAIQASQQLEKEFGLTPTDHTSKRERARQTKAEQAIEKQLKKEGKKMSKEHIADAIDRFVESRSDQSYTLDELRAGLAEDGVEVDFTQRGGEIVGVKYQYGGVWVSGSNIGPAYKAQSLFERGLTKDSQAQQQTQPQPQQVQQQQPGQPSRHAQAAAKHHAAAHDLGHVFARALAIPIEALRALIRAIISMINRLLGRRELAAGAPAGALGRFDQTTGHYKPGRVPKTGEPGSEETAAAMEKTAEDLSFLADKVESGRWSELLDHGPAPYKHDPDGKPSYFARLKGPDGKETEVWGVDIQRALEQVEAQPGDLVSLERAGRKTVTVDGKQTHRNSWAATKAPDLPELEADRAALRDSAVRFLRDKVDYLGARFGKGGPEQQAVLDQLQRLRYSHDDEARYKLWRRDTPGALPQDGETDDDFIRRRELEHLDDQLAFNSRHPGVMNDKQIGHAKERIATLTSEAGSVDVAREIHRGRG